MRIALALATAFTIATAVAACHDHEHDYDSLEACMVDHTVEEMLPEYQALVVCLTDHFDLDWQTQAECETYVAAHGGYPDSRVAACMEYIRQKGL